MGIIATNDLRHICLVCFNRCSKEELQAHHHCCDTGNGCEKKLLEIIKWERKQFGESYLEVLAQEF